MNIPSFHEVLQGCHGNPKPLYVDLLVAVRLAVDIILDL
jgi:hypothetical protein